MTMTVGKLHKLLGKMIEDGAARRRVCVSKGTFQDNRESDGCTILDAYDCRLKSIYLSDEDGGIAKRVDGSERTAVVAVLYGNCDDGEK